MCAASAWVLISEILLDLALLGGSATNYLRTRLCQPQNVDLGGKNSQLYLMSSVSKRNCVS